MKRDLLQIYAKNHLAPLHNPLIVAALFLASRIYLYGIPQPKILVFGVFLGIAALALLLLQRRLCLHIASQPEKNGWKDALLLAATRGTLMSVWLAMLFWPLKAPYLYDHILGYFFSFCAIMFAASSSAAFFPLLLCDIGTVVAGAAIVTFINREIQETPYVGGILTLFAAYALVSGRKIGESTKQLLQNKRELEKSRNMAEQANRAKSDFLAIMSHEIRTPMSGILGMVSFLKDTRLTDEQKTCIDTISECSKNLMNTLNDVLDISRMEAGKLPINPTNFDLRALLENSMTIARFAASGKNITLGMNISKDIPIAIHADPNRIQQIVVNLLNNAVKFTESGAIALSAALRKDLIRIEVTDTGIGIGEEEQKKLFTKFSQADGGIERKYGGSGLGLSIARNLVELMGGRMGVISAKGKGSTFWFEIPCIAPVVQPAATDDDPIHEDVTGLNVLLVEDNAVNRMIASRLLEARQHKITQARDGDAAVTAVRREHFDIILMDVNLPIKDGLKASREIRAMGGVCEAIPIIAITANAMEDNLKKCRDAGMVDHIVKPYTPEQFYRVLAKHAVKRHPALQTKSKLAAAEQELGSEYVSYLIETCLAETERLLKQIQIDHYHRNYDSLSQAAHDLKSVSGSIDLASVSAAAERVENACMQKEYRSLKKLVVRLNDTARQDMAALRIRHPTAKTANLPP